MRLSKNATLLAVPALLFALAIGFGPGNASAQPFSIFSSGDLSVGSRGQPVVDLQGILAEMGYLDIPSNTPLGYFGPLTKNALAKYQAALGVPNTGYYGAMTRAAIFNQFLSRKWINSTGAIALGGTYSELSMQSAGSAGGIVLGASTSTGQGYWYNGTWYQAATTTGGGYFSSNPGTTTLGSMTSASNANSTNTSAATGTTTY